jgi:hypothetical protein
VALRPSLIWIGRSNPPVLGPLWILKTNNLKLATLKLG